MRRINFRGKGGSGPSRPRQCLGVASVSIASRLSTERTLGRREKDEGGEDVRQMSDVVTRLKTKLTTFLKHSPRLTSSIKRCILRDMYSMRVPIMSCIGMIQDFRRPKDEKKTESTMGDHISLSEYGYPDSANVASCEYESCF